MTNRRLMLITLEPKYRYPDMKMGKNTINLKEIAINKKC